DTGIGMTPAMLPRVFEMFAQSDVSRERAKGGLGIGLTLVKKLVELHGGTVEAQSDGVERGSEFVVRLPLAEDYRESPASHSPQATSADTSFSRLPILVVDDNRDAADSLGTILTRLGLTVRVVYDGSAALEIMANWRPAVVLLDIGMPGMDGYD